MEDRGCNYRRLRVFFEGVGRTQTITRAHWPWFLSGSVVGPLVACTVTDILNLRIHVYSDEDFVRKIKIFEVINVVTPLQQPTIDLHVFRSYR